MHHYLHYSPVTHGCSERALSIRKVIENGVALEGTRSTVWSAVVYSNVFFFTARGRCLPIGFEWLCQWTGPGDSPASNYMQIQIRASVSLAQCADAFTCVRPFLISICISISLTTMIFYSTVISLLLGYFIQLFVLFDSQTENRLVSHTMPKVNHVGLMKPTYNQNKLFFSSTDANWGQPKWMVSNLFKESSCFDWNNMRKDLSGL